MVASDLLNRFDSLRATGINQWKSLCPAHDDHDPSLSISQSDNKFILHCFAGCKPESIVEKIGLEMKDLFLDEPRREKRLVATYKYYGANGIYCYEKRRYDPKSFLFFTGETVGLNGQKHILYEISRVTDATANGKPIFLVEGEKDVDTLISKGFIATTLDTGAGVTNLSPLDDLVGVNVYIIPDQDKPGIEHGNRCASYLQGKAKDIHIVNIPDGKDISEYFDRGYTIDEFQALVDAAMLWTLPKMESIEHLGNDSDIRSKLWDISQKKGFNATEKNREIADMVVEWLKSKGQFYHTPENQFSGVMFFDKTRKQLLSIQGDDLHGWLSDQLSINRNETLFKFIAAGIETEGLTHGKIIEPAVFWGHQNNVVYLSCGPGRIARISAGEVKLVDNGTDGILFRPIDCLPSWNLCTPINPFKKCRLFSDLSTTDNGRILFLLWVVSLPTDQKTKPPLCMTGTVGSGKTRAIRGIFELFGVPERVSQVKERYGDGDFWASVNSGGLLCLDNVDSKNPWLPDALAAASTAGTFDKRQLYTDSGRISLRARAWVAITSANPLFGSDSGLSDRLQVIRLNRRTGETNDSQLSDEISENRDAGLSWICHTLAKAMADEQPTPKGLNSRHPDFASMAVRIGRAIDQEKAVITAIKAAEIDKSVFCIENDLIGAGLVALCKEKSFSGTASDLKYALQNIDSSIEQLSTKRISKRLYALWPHLETVFAAKKESDGHSKTTKFHFAGFAGIETAFAQNSRENNNIGTFVQNLNETPQYPQVDALQIEIDSGLEKYSYFRDTDW